MCDSITDEQIVEGLLAGDRSIFTALYEKYGEDLKTFVATKYLKRDYTMAEDIVQITLMKLYQSIDQFDRSMPLRPWLFSVAGNAAIDSTRYKSRRRTVSFNDLFNRVGGDDNNLTGDEIWELRDQSDVNEYEDVQYDEAREMLKNSMAMLNERDIEAINMIYFEKMSYRDVAAKLGITKSAVKSRIVRALAAMRGGFHEDFISEAA